VPSAPPPPPSGAAPSVRTFDDSVPAAPWQAKVPASTGCVALGLIPRIALAVTGVGAGIIVRYVVLGVAVDKEPFDETFRRSMQPAGKLTGYLVLPALLVAALVFSGSE